jgi:hypothetical protein
VRERTMRQAYPVIKRQPQKPSQKFDEWVAQFGPIRLARSLGVARSSVHSWVTISGNRRKPRMETVFDLIALSRIEPLRGEEILTVYDILGEVKIINMEVHQ